MRADSPPLEVTLCHATDADTNPYRVITVSFNSISHLNKVQTVEGHGDHTGPVWQAGDQAAHIKWGDIIPAYDWTGDEGTVHYTGMNLTTAGQAILDSGCQIPRKAVVVTTTVFDKATDKALTGQETAGASVYDTARVVPPSAVPAPTGTVTYIYYTSDNCVSASALGADHITVTLNAGKVPNSMTEGPLSAGSYSFKANYSGDGNYLGGTSACEPFTINETPPPPKKSVVVSTTVFDESTEKPLTGDEMAGTTVYDTAKVVPPSAVPVPTGTVTYIYYTSGNCVAANALGADHLTVTLNAGQVPISMTEGPLTAGDYSFRANYSGDANYAAGTSACEPFTVNETPPPPKKSVVVTTTVFDSKKEAALTGKETAGTSVYDTAKVVPPSAVPAPTGTVTYIYYTSGNCVAANALGADHLTVTLSAGKVPDSMTEGPLPAGSYSFKANYSGDTHYLAATSACEPLTILKADPGITTNQNPVSGLVGATIKDSASITGGFNPTGTVTFVLKLNDSTVLTSDPIALDAKGNAAFTTGYLANAAGTYYWIATYNGDPNNNTVSSGATDEPVIISTQLVPAIVTTPDPKSTTVGATLKDTATIGGIANPNGYILFTLKDPNGNTAWTKKMTVTANGSYKTPDGSVANVQGTWHWIAGYYDAEGTLIVQSGANDEPVTVGPTGGVLAQTAADLPGQQLAGGLLVIGLLAIFGAFAWRRRLV